MAASSASVSVLYEWVTVEYDWTAAERAAALASGAFIPENNAITGKGAWHVTSLRPVTASALH